MRLKFTFFAFLYAIPALIALITFQVHARWVVGAFGVAVLVFGVWHALGRAAASVISAIGAATSVLFLAGWYFQGEGFNDRFFYHFNIESLLFGVGSYPIFIYGGGAYLLVCAAYPWVFGKRDSEPMHVDNSKVKLGIGITAVLLSALFFVPLSSAIDYMRYRIDDSSSSIRIDRVSRTVETVELEVAPKNLVLIYAESLERTYFDENLFPGLMPNLTVLAQDALEFTNVHQVRGTGWTIAGIVASQCSLPFNIKYIDGQEPNIGLSAVKAPFENEVCMGDILDAYGYENVFMGGA